jgi:hypothetical protein
MIGGLLKTEGLMNQDLRMTRQDYSNFNKGINNLLSREDLHSLLQTTHKVHSPIHQTTPIPLLQPTKVTQKKTTGISINSQPIYMTIRDGGLIESTLVIDTNKIDKKPAYVNSQRDEFNIKINKLIDWGKNNKNPVVMGASLGGQKPTCGEIQ